MVKSFGDKNLQFVEENVNNGEFYRYYEISPVANRNLLRVTLYGKVSTFAFRSRGKNTIRSLDRVLTYIQQSDRKAPILKKQIDEEDESMEEEEEEEEQKEQMKATVVAPTP